MEIVDPKCPKCGSSKFVYKHIPKYENVKTYSREIISAEERLKSITDEEKKKSRVESIKKWYKNLERLFDKPDVREAEAMMVFCVNCGEIIGIGGGRFNV